VTSIKFSKPFFFGNELSDYAEFEKTCHASIAVRIESCIRRGISGNAAKATEGLFVHVAPGGERRPGSVSA